MTCVNVDDIRPMIVTADFLKNALPAIERIRCLTSDLLTVEIDESCTTSLWPRKSIFVQQILTKLQIVCINHSPYLQDLTIQMSGIDAAVISEHNIDAVEALSKAFIELYTNPKRCVGLGSDKVKELIVTILMATQNDTL